MAQAARPRDAHLDSRSLADSPGPGSSASSGRTIASPGSTRVSTRAPALRRNAARRSRRVCSSGSRQRASRSRPAAPSGSGSPVSSQAQFISAPALQPRTGAASVTTAPSRPRQPALVAGDGQGGAVEADHAAQRVAQHAHPRRPAASAARYQSRQPATASALSISGRRVSAPTYGVGRQTPSTRRLAGVGALDDVAARVVAAAFGQEADQSAERALGVAGARADAAEQHQLGAPAAGQTKCPGRQLGTGSCGSVGRTHPLRVVDRAARSRAFWPAASGTAESLVGRWRERPTVRPT